ncbi:MAG TPA: hypothetical protein VIJ51_08535 [Solirubrobacteraceae bacterium]
MNEGRELAGAVAVLAGEADKLVRSREDGTAFRSAAAADAGAVATTKLE